MATSGLSVINLVGTGIGFLVPGLVVSEDDVGAYQMEIKKLLVLEAMVIAPLNILTILFIRNKPPTPPR